MAEPKRNEGDSQPIVTQKPQTAPLKPPDNLLELRVERLEIQDRLERFKDELFMPFVQSTSETIGGLKTAVATLQDTVKRADEKATNAVAVVNDIEHRLMTTIERLNQSIATLTDTVKKLSEERDQLKAYVDREMAEAARKQKFITNTQRFFIFMGRAAIIILSTTGGAALLVEFLKLVTNTR